MRKLTLSVALPSRGALPVRLRACSSADVLVDLRPMDAGSITMICTACAHGVASVRRTTRGWTLICARRQVGDITLRYFTSRTRGRTRGPQFSRQLQQLRTGLKAIV